MLVNQVFEAWLFPDPQSALSDLNHPYTLGENITEGILNVDITSGIQTYEGPQQQIDTGQFTIVSRNPNLDPKINTNLKYDSTIKFYDTRSGEFFRGFVTDIQVEYQRDDNPIITITGTDIFGAMQRVVVSQTIHDAIKALSTGPTWSGITFTEFMPYMAAFTSKYLEIDGITPPGYPAPLGFWFPASQSYGELNVGNMNYSPAKYIPQVGETYLDVITKYAQTNLTSFSAKSDFGALSYNYISVTPFIKYDPNSWTPQIDPKLIYTTYDFSSDPAQDRSYETILLDNGFNRVINQVDISNESRYVDAGEVKSDTLNFTRTSDESIANYAISAASVSTIFPSDNALPEATWANNYAQNIFQVSQFPAQEIKQITFDNARAQMIEDEWSYSDYSLDRLIRIKHQINNNQTIDNVYNIAGISHNISVDKWEMAFTLKPSKEQIAYEFQGQLPTLQMNSTIGDSNFNFTASIVNYDTSKISNVVWALSAADADEIFNIYPYAYNGAFYKNLTPRTGLTQTWNFDDDGILRAYFFDADSTYQNPTDNRFGGRGAGNWYVYAFITLTNGFVIVLQQQLTVGVPAVQADFGWQQNLTTNFGQVQFTDTSVNHETGEPDSYLWNFGDGTTSTERNPLKIYTGDGTSYSVSLTVFAYGNNATKVYSTKTSTVTLAQPTMVPNYTYTIFNSTVTFTNTSTNVGLEEPDAYLWNFGDGTTSTLKNPTKTYSGNAGDVKTFNVSLTTRNMFETTATVTKTITFTMTFDVGNYPVNSIRFRSASSYALPANTYGTPYMWNLKALTTGDNSNLMYLNPVTRSNTSNIVWYEMDGTVDETNDPLNLTRDTGPNSQLGLAALSANNNPTSFTLSTTLPSPALNLQTFSLNLKDITAGNTGNWRTIYIDINTNLGWRQVGYFRLGRNRVGDIVPAVGDTLPKITNATRTMIPTRVLPLNNLNFDYSQQANSRTVNFTTTTAGPWNWNFGDGTTSTQQNPTKTYSSNELSTYSVSLNGVTEKVKLRFPIPFSFRYIRLRQKLHTGVSGYDTPTLYNFSLQTAATGTSAFNGPYISPGGLTNPQSIASQKYIGAGGFTVAAGGSVISLIGSQSLTNDTGIRFKWEQSNPPDPIPYQTQWDLAIDYKELITIPIEEITCDFNANGVGSGGLTNASFVEYEVFASAHNANVTSQQQGDPALIPGWVKIGEIKPGDGLAVNLNARQQRTMIPQYT